MLRVESRVPRAGRDALSLALQRKRGCRSRFRRVFIGREPPEIAAPRRCAPSLRTSTSSTGRSTDSSRASVLLDAGAVVHSGRIQIIWRPIQQANIVAVRPGPDVDPNDLQKFSFVEGAELSPGVGIELLTLTIEAQEGAPVGSFIPLLEAGNGLTELAVGAGRYDATTDRLHRRRCVGQSGFLSEPPDPHRSTARGYRRTPARSSSPASRKMARSCAASATTTVAMARAGGRSRSIAIRTAS